MHDIIQKCLAQPCSFDKFVKNSTYGKFGSAGSPLYDLRGEPDVILDDGSEVFFKLNSKVLKYDRPSDAKMRELTAKMAEAMTAPDCGQDRAYMHFPATPFASCYYNFKRNQFLMEWECGAMPYIDHTGVIYGYGVRQGGKWIPVSGEIDNG